MESQLDKIGRNLKSDEHWTSTTIYRPSRRNQSELYLPEVHGNLTGLSFLSSRTQFSFSFSFYYVFCIKYHKTMQCSQLAIASRGEHCLQ